MSSAIAIPQTICIGDFFAAPRPMPTRGTGGRIFPELAPVGSTRGGPRIRFNSRAVQHETTQFTKRGEHRDIIARLTVNVINLTIMLFAFPLGFGLLIFNILGGENLRTTAHAMALTGLAMALGATGTMPTF